jgi:hypothetical protein
VEIGWEKRKKKVVARERKRRSLSSGMREIFLDKSMRPD